MTSVLEALIKQADSEKVQDRYITFKGPYGQGHAYSPSKAKDEAIHLSPPRADMEVCGMLGMPGMLF